MSGGDPNMFDSTKRDIYVELEYDGSNFGTTPTKNNDRTPSWGDGGSCHAAPFDLVDTGSAYHVVGTSSAASVTFSAYHQRIGSDPLQGSATWSIPYNDASATTITLGNPTEASLTVQQ